MIYSEHLTPDFYYLYPLLEEDSPDFILVFNKPGYSRAGYGMYADFGEKSFILKKE